MSSLLRAFISKIWKWLRTWRDTPFVRKFGVEYRPIQGFAYVQGFLTEGEAIYLHDLTKRLPSEAPVVVEIGTWQGKSTVAISHGLAGKAGARLICVDPFDATNDPEYQAAKQGLRKSLLETFQSNMAMYGNTEVIELRQGYSYEVIKDWDTPIDFLFMDASHDYEDVLRDFVEWSPHIKVGGVIAFHHVRLVPHRMDISGPGQVIRDHIFHHENWENVTEPLDESIYAARKLR